LYWMLLLLLFLVVGYLVILILGVFSYIFEAV